MIYCMIHFIISKNRFVFFFTSCRAMKIDSTKQYNIYNEMGVPKAINEDDELNMISHVIPQPEEQISE